MIGTSLAYLGKFDSMDLCVCRYEADDLADNLPNVFMTTTIMNVEIDGDISPTLL